MVFFVPAGAPEHTSHNVYLKRGARRTIFLFVVTIIMAVLFEQLLDLPPFMGMMTGLSLLMFLAYYLQRSRSESDPAYDIFTTIKNVDWDTLLFFFGVMFSVGGLAFIGYLELASTVMYGHLGPTLTNILLGAVSAIVDNIPIMFSVLTMGPEMDHYQWLLITLTCGVGGSILAIGSAAGVALLGVGKGSYTFIGHLKWTPVITFGYFAGIAVHYLING